MPMDGDLQMGGREKRLLIITIAIIELCNCNAIDNVLYYMYI